MAKIFQDEAVHIVCVRSHTFVVFFLSHKTCLLYTSDAADERSSVDLGGRRIINKKQKKKKNNKQKKKTHKQIQTDV